MNKIEFNGKEILDIDEVNNAISDVSSLNTITSTLSSDISTLDLEMDSKVSSNEITEIRVVNDYPQVEEQGVLYIKVQSNQ